MNNDLELDPEIAKAFTMLEPNRVVTIEYRLHYDDAGNITMCSMQSHPESSQYVVVDKAVYDQYFRYRIVKGLPQLISYDPGIVPNLVKAQTGFQVVKNNAAILVEDFEQYHDTEYYDYRNN